MRAGDSNIMIPTNQGTVSGWISANESAPLRYQWRVVANAMDSCTLPIFSKLVFQEVCR